MSDKLNYKDLSLTDLQNRLKEFGDELVQAKQKHRLGQFKKTSEFGRIRKEIARIKTNIRMREISEKKTERKTA